jgi:hypothetical protein
MRDTSVSRLGGSAAVLVGISYAVAGAAYLLMPVEQQTWRDPGAYLSSFAQNPTASLLESWALAVGAVFALAVVGAVSERVRSVNEGWVCWTRTLALVGFAVTAVQYFRYLALHPARAAAYVAADAGTKSAIAANQSLMLLDPYGWLTYGGVGAFFFVVNVAALRGRIWPRPLAYVGIAGAIAYGLLLAGGVLQVEVLIAAAAASGVVLAPVWYIWTGLILRRASS